MVCTMHSKGEESNTTCMMYKSTQFRYRDHTIFPLTVRRTTAGSEAGRQNRTRAPTHVRFSEPLLEGKTELELCGKEIDDKYSIASLAFSTLEGERAGRSIEEGKVLSGRDSYLGVRRGATLLTACSTAIFENCIALV